MVHCQALVDKEMQIAKQKIDTIKGAFRLFNDVTQVLPKDIEYYADDIKDNFKMQITEALRNSAQEIQAITTGTQEFTADLLQYHSKCNVIVQNLNKLTQKAVMRQSTLQKEYKQVKERYLLRGRPLN